jgi:hypothetical protein
MTFSAYSFELMINRKGIAAWAGTIRVDIIDSFMGLLGHELHCMDAWLKHKDSQLAGQANS